MQSPTMTRTPATQMAVSPRVVPLPGETQGDFFARAWQILAGSGLKANKRTIAIIRAWKESPNDADLRQEAIERFPPDQFVHNGPRCIFISHTIPDIPEERDEAGNVVEEAKEGTVYNRANLQKVIDYANYRIRNSGMFSSLSLGHMPTAEEKEKGIPDAPTMGHCGPFYIGLFGNVKPQWAIFADEWLYKDTIDEAKKLQRRSPELWHREPIDRRTMDPVAMLGSETPRLDSGMDLYAKRADGELTMRYSMSSMALPGAYNTYVPHSGGRQKYGASSMADTDFNDGSQPSGEPDQKILDMIVDVISEQVSQLMPTLIQGVTDKLREQSQDDDAVPQDGGDGSQGDSADPGMEGQQLPPDQPDGQAPRGMEPSAEDQGGLDQGQPGESDATAGIPQQPNDPIAALSSGPQTDPNAMPSQPTLPAAGGMSADPMGGAGAGSPDMGLPDTGADPSPGQSNQPLDQEHARYAAMSPQCGEAYAAGHSAASRKGRNPMAQTTNYSKTAESVSMEARLNKLEADNAKLLKQNAAQLQRIEDMENTARDVERYAKIREIGKLHDIGDEAEVLQDCITASEEDFEKYCKILRRSAPKGDATNVEIYDDNSFDPEANVVMTAGQTQNYSRRAGGRKVPSQDEITRYSRQAGDIASRKRFKKIETSYEKELETILVAHGYDANVLTVGNPAPAV